MQAGVPFEGGRRPDAVSVGDLSLDGAPDIAVVSNSIDKDIRILYGVGDGSFFSAQVLEGGDDFQNAITIADLNLDGIPDVAVTEEGNTIRVLLGQGDGMFPTFVSAGEFFVGGVISAIVVADLNLDGTPDLAIRLSPGVRVLPNRLIR